MFGLAAFATGLTSRNSCAEIVPCRGAALLLRGRPFKLSCCVHAIELTTGVSDAPVFATSERAFVSITVGDKTKRTEMGDARQNGTEIIFNEALTLEVTPRDDIVVAVHTTQQLNLVVAALALSSKVVGESCFPISSVLPKLRMEDRDIDGIVHVTPRSSFDLVGGGRKLGRIHITFETKQPPPMPKNAGALADGPWCAFDGMGGAMSARRYLGAQSCDDEHLQLLAAGGVTSRSSAGDQSARAGPTGPISCPTPQQRGQHIMKQEQKQQHGQQVGKQLHNSQYGDHRDHLPAPPPAVLHR